MHDPATPLIQRADAPLHPAMSQSADVPVPVDGAVSISLLAGL